MGILDEAKGRLGDAAEWVKDQASQLGESTQGAGRALGEKAAEARHRVAGARVGDNSPAHGAEQGGRDEDATAEAPSHSGGGGDFASEWVDVTTDPDAGGPQAAEDDEPVDGPLNPL
jgi:hypothetical protein